MGPLFGSIFGAPFLVPILGPVFGPFFGSRFRARFSAPILDPPSLYELSGVISCGPVFGAFCDPNFGPDFLNFF